MPRTQVNGVQIYSEITGDVGEPVVLVHGSWGDHQNWESVTPALSQSFRVLTYDRRGHSRSERPVGQGSIHQDAADLAALLDELGHRPAHIVGSSFGASIVLRLAASRPDLFRSMIVHEPPLFGLLRDEPTTRGALSAVQDRISAVASLLAAGDWTGGARQFVETIAGGPGAWEKLPQRLRDTFTFNASTWLDEVRDPEALEMDLSGLGGFAAPAMVTAGGQSPPIFPLVVRRIAAVLPQVTVRTYDGAGHAPHLSHPGEFLETVTDFIKGGAVGDSASDASR
jgi:pimeloyl-ACP methyl ester carboxylesterase